jgi:hypothetical protein
MPVKTRSQTKTTTQETPDEHLSDMEETPGKGGHVTDCRSLMTEFSDLFHP